MFYLYVAIHAKKYFMHLSSNKGGTQAFMILLVCKIETYQWPKAPIACQSNGSAKFFLIFQTFFRGPI